MLKTAVGVLNNVDRDRLDDPIFTVDRQEGGLCLWEDFSASFSTTCLLDSTFVRRMLLVNPLLIQLQPHA